MGAMTLPAPSTEGRLTRADLDAMPPDGRRHELIDGAIVVTPAPSRRHQRASIRLAAQLLAACSPHLEVLAAPFDVALSEHTVVEPDLLVAPVDAFTDADLPTAPLLVIEILSPSTRLLDLRHKLGLYEEAGVEHYWVLDPRAERLVVHRLRSGRFEVVADVTGDESFEATEPFDVEVVPAALLRDPSG